MKISRKTSKKTVKKVLTLEEKTKLFNKELNKFCKKLGIKVTIQSQLMVNPEDANV